MKKEFRFLLVALIVTNIFFIAIATNYKNKSDKINKAFKVYSVNGENDYLKITDGIIIESYNKDILDAGRIEYLGDNKKDLKSYKIQICAYGNNNEKILFCTNCKSENYEKRLFSFPGDLETNIGRISGEYITKQYDKKYLLSNMYLKLNLQFENGKKEEYKVKLNVKQI
ncbi:hypothetical protein [Clostridium sp. Ade.TY]|uniref:hypothetical protein n=1 Tax=Clostridium sp. Ade.TY TaxID=1391647 RepID=UPI00040DF7A3|nr:hypothetical protein [Clostridium sp. Ade.TY]